MDQMGRQAVCIDWNDFISHDMMHCFYLYTYHMGPTRADMMIEVGGDVVERQFKTSMRRVAEGRRRRLYHWRKS